MAETVAFALYMGGGPAAVFNGPAAVSTDD
jgi:hypothetical protein